MSLPPEKPNELSRQQSADGNTTSQTALPPKEQPAANPDPPHAHDRKHAPPPPTFLAYQKKSDESEKSEMQSIFARPMMGKKMNQ